MVIQPAIGLPLQGNMAAIDLGTLNWEYSSTYHAFFTRIQDRDVSGESHSDFICGLYETSQGLSTMPNLSMRWGNVPPSVTLYVRNDSAGTSTSAFKALISGVLFLYHKAV